ncbi:uncharacterized protein J7T54_007671 [Emericellopsis cladophorae]|uniref:HpcH/HpaI aldolase/citrate lyase domain-containing protein n=1 Tax=Emericellopsis cladophorae TaxID=2686198 RepID=A0A9P9XUK9_9HYPO|nr:uncharacterized protein J7T54_007671 [Emericellopsis cladophorae]KAI6778063.1 hypothetical protein J7T54_007671 [Emericellopsis cladophorae]
MVEVTEMYKNVQEKGMLAYAAPSLFQPHHARQAIRDAHEKKIGPLLGYYAGLSSVPITRMLAPMNYDCVWVDWEHTSCNVETMTEMVHQAIFMSQGHTIPWVRVPGHDHAAIGYALDAGASIVVPQVDTVEQAKHVVSAAKFGAKIGGSRSAPPFRLIPGLTDQSYHPHKDVFAAVNDQAAIMIQIESLEAINNLDDILTEVGEHIDIVWLGSLDARISMGLPGQFGSGGEPEWLAARDKFFQVIQKHDKPYGGFSIGSAPFGTLDTIRQASERMSFMVVSGDVLHLMAMQKDLADARSVAGDFVQGSNGKSAANDSNGV